MKPVTRRELLKALTVGGMTLSAPSLALFGTRRCKAAGPNGEIRVAVIGLGGINTVGGVGGRGRQIIANFRAVPGVRIAALCDVDQVILDHEVGRLKERGENGRGLCRPSQGVRRQDDRRGGHRHAQPLARLGHDLGVPGRQGRLRGETVLPTTSGRVGRWWPRPENTDAWCKSAPSAAPAPCCSRSSSTCAAARSARYDAPTPCSIVRAKALARLSEPTPVPPRSTTTSGAGRPSCSRSCGRSCTTTGTGSGPLATARSATTGCIRSTLPAGCWGRRSRLPGHEHRRPVRFPRRRRNRQYANRAISTIAPLRSFAKSATSAANKGANAIGKFRGVAGGVVIDCEGGYVAGDFTGSSGVRQARAKNQGHCKDDRKTQNQEVASRGQLRGSRSQPKLGQPQRRGLGGARLRRLLSHGEPLVPAGQADASRSRFSKRPERKSELSDAFERCRDYLRENGLDLRGTPAVLGPWLTLDGEQERFVGEFADRANQLSHRDYRGPFVVPEIA